MADSAGRGASRPKAAKPRKSRRLAVTEKMIGQACDTLAANLGYIVDRYEQGRATRITEGLPDRRYWHRPRRARLWVELKAPGGKLTERQHIWLLSELDAGGLATVIEDPQQLAKVLGILARPMGFMDAKQLCYGWVHLCAQRGWR